MRSVFDDREMVEAAPRQDTEITLGSATLLLIFFALVLLCGVCFGFGYSIGHHGPQETTEGLAAAGAVQNTAQADIGRLKPSAIQSSSASSPVNPQSMASGSAAGAQSALVRPAIPNAPAAVSGELPPASAVSPALAASGQLMVQIAAVAQQEDADVLTAALRKRGYAVTARHEPLDGLIHVRIGPFKTRSEAETWRQKLLNDGYNAIVQP